MKFIKSLTKKQMENIIENVDSVGIHGELILENTEKAHKAVKQLYPKLQDVDIFYGIKGENI